MTDHESPDAEFSLKRLFIPFTTLKAIHWIVIIGLVVYFISLFNGFVWDDYPFLLNNTDVHSINIFHLFSKNTFNVASFYRPLPALYNALIYKISGDTPFLYHFIQVVLHCTNACLVYLLFIKFLRKPLSFFLSLLFLIHPINVEAVAYISAANNELFFLFGMLALLISMKDTIRKVHLFLICGFSLLSLLSREIGFAFLFLIVLFQFLYSKKRIYIIIAIEAFALALYILLRFVYAGIYYTKLITRYPIPIAQLPLMQRLENIPSILFYYFFHIIYPANFAVSQHWIVENKTINNFYFPLFINSLLIALFTILAVYIYKRKREFFGLWIFFSFWFLSGIVFVLQIVPLELTVADHWMYFSLVGLLGLFGVGLEVIIMKFQSKNKLSKTVKKCIFVIAILSIVLLSLRTTVRILNYKDEITLYAHDSTIYDDWIVENDLGSDYALIGDMKNAYIHFKRSYDYSPTPWNLYDLGLYYQDSGNTKKAFSYYSRAYAAMGKSEFTSSIKHGQSNLEYNLYLRLANRSLFDKNYTASIGYSKIGLRYYPNASDLWVALAASEYFVGHQKEALTAAIHAKELSPSSNNDYLYNQIKNNKQLNIVK